MQHRLDIVPRSKMRQVVVQGDHRARIIHLFRVLREEFENEFTEDNDPTRNAFLLECFEESQQKNPELPINYPYPKDEAIMLIYWRGRLSALLRILSNVQLPIRDIM